MKAVLSPRPKKTWLTGCDALSANSLWPRDRFPHPRVDKRGTSGSEAKNMSSGVLLTRPDNCATLKGRRLKVIRIIARLNIGGPAIHAIVLTDEFNRRRHDSLLVAGSVAPGEASMEYLAQGKRVSLLKIPQLSREISWKDLVTFCKIVAILLREKPDVVHTHTAKAGALGRVAAFVCRVPVRFHTFHGHVFDGYFSARKVRLFIALERLLARLSTRVVVVSPRLRDEISLRYRIAPVDKITVVPLGLDLNRFRSISPPPLDRFEPVILWVGRLVEVKDPFFLLRTALELRRLNVPARFIMVGDGQLRAEMERRIRDSNLEGCVSLAGWQQSMCPWYAQSHILALTSLNEGTPVAMIEAMAAGRPCVAPDVGGVADLMLGTPEEQPEGFAVFNNGILLRRREPAVMARALTYLIARPLLSQRMGGFGAEFALRSFSKERLAEDLISLYQGCLEQRVA